MTGDKSVNGWLTTDVQDHASYKTILACYKSKGHIWKKKSKRKEVADYVDLDRDYKQGLLKQES